MKCVGYLLSAMWGCRFPVSMVLLWNVLNALVLRQLWEMFIVPTFNLPALSIPSAFGIMLIISLLKETASLTSRGGASPKSRLDVILEVVLVPLSYLAIGWIIRQFM